MTNYDRYYGIYGDFHRTKKNTSIICTYLNSYLLGTPREYVLHGLDPGLDWASRWLTFSRVFPVCPGTPIILLFVPLDRVYNLTPSLLFGRLLTNAQVNNTAAHIYLYITSALLFFFSFTLLPLFLAGRLAQSLPIWHSYQPTFLYCTWSSTSQRLIRIHDFLPLRKFSYIIDLVPTPNKPIFDRLPSFFWWLSVI